MWALPRLLVQPLLSEDRLAPGSSSLRLTSILLAVAKVALFFALTKGEMGLGEQATLSRYH